MTAESAILPAFFRQDLQDLNKISCKSCPMIDSHHALLRIGRVVEKGAQLDAAMSELREVEGVPIARIKVRGSVVRRKDHQRV